MDLDEIRAKINEVDETIIKLLAKRFELTSEIGFLKAMAEYAHFGMGNPVCSYSSHDGAY
jgi:chorismate mutase